MDNPELMDRAEQDLERCIIVLHQSGLNYWQILGLVLNLAERLHTQADVEYFEKRAGS